MFQSDINWLRHVIDFSIGHVGGQRTSHAYANCYNKKARPEIVGETNRTNEGE